MKKTINISFLIILFFNLVLSTSSYSVGVYETSYENANYDTIENIREDIYENVHINIVEDVYLHDFDKYLRITLGNDEASFVEYFSDWQKTALDKNFFEYSQFRSDSEQLAKKLYKYAISNIAIGTVIIVTPFIVSFLAPSESIVTAVFYTVGKQTLNFATSGAIIGGAIECANEAINYYSKNNLSSVNLTLANLLKGISLGFKDGAIVGLIAGGVKSYNIYHNAEVISRNGEPIILCGDGKIRDFKGAVCDKFQNYCGIIDNTNGRAVVNRGMLGRTNRNGIEYKYFLADDGNGNFAKIVNPDFERLVAKEYSVPRELWSSSDKSIQWCKNQYIKDLSSPNVENILGISKKEAAMRLRYETRSNLRDNSFMKMYKLSEGDVVSFLENYSSGEWHHLPESGKMIFVEPNHGSHAPHTGGNSIWGEKASEILWR